jgi:hypothetical protein
LLFSRDHVREKQRKLVGSGAITDGATDAKNASVDNPLTASVFGAKTQMDPFFRP